MKTIGKIDTLLAKAESGLITFILSVMILLSFGQVILRNFFNQGILWADILLRQWVLWVGFLGASLAVREDRHIAISFLPNFMPPSWRPRVSGLVHLFTACVGAILAYAAWTFVQFEREGSAKLFGSLPVWWFQLILPYSFSVIAVRHLLKAWGSLFASESPPP